MGFSERLKEARKNAKLTQQQLGDLIGVANSTIAGYESGNSEPDMSKINKLLNALSIDANFLWQDEIGTVRAPNISIEAQTIAEQYDKAPEHIKAIVKTALEYPQDQSEVESSPA